MDSAHWDSRYSASGPLWPAEPNGWVRDVVAQLKPGRAVDIAAGEGRHSVWLAGLGWQVDAVDFSQAGLDRGRAAARERGLAHLITWVVADVVAAPLPPGSYDLAVVAYLQLPAPAFGTALRSAAARLGPGGTLVVVGHDARNLTEGTGGPQDPRVLYTPEEVAAHLTGTALVVERAETARRQVPGTNRAALDAVVTARRR